MKLTLRSRSGFGAYMGQRLAIQAFNVKLIFFCGSDHVVDVSVNRICQNEGLPIRIQSLESTSGARVGRESIATGIYKPEWINYRSEVVTLLWVDLSLLWGQGSSFRTLAI